MLLLLVSALETENAEDKVDDVDVEFEGAGEAGFVVVMVLVEGEEDPIPPELFDAIGEPALVEERVDDAPPELVLVLVLVLELVLVPEPPA